MNRPGGIREHDVGLVGSAYCTVSKSTADGSAPVFVLDNLDAQPFCMNADLFDGPGPEVSPAPITTEKPCFLRYAPIFATVVVLPVPFTPVKRILTGRSWVSYIAPGGQSPSRAP